MSTLPIRPAEIGSLRVCKVEEIDFLELRLAHVGNDNIVSLEGEPPGIAKAIRKNFRAIAGADIRIVGWNCVRLRTALLRVDA